jgi:glutathione S-transferase
MTAPFRLYGAELSPYSLKVRSYLRFKGLEFEWLPRTNARQEEFARYAKLPLIPVLVDANETVLQDSTPMIEALEAEYSDPSIIPGDPVLAFVSALLEDYADEWLNKAMFHYRWSYEADQQSASRRIAELIFGDAPAPEGAEEGVRARMIARLYHVGSSPETAPVIEASFRRVLGLMEPLLSERPYLFGGTPSLADFGLAGQFAQLLSDPTPGAMIRAQAPNLARWVARMDNPRVEGAFVDFDAVKASLGDLMRSEVAATYLVWAAANAEAVANDAPVFTVDIAGAPFSQKPQRYAAKAFAEIRRKRELMAYSVELTMFLDETGCEHFLRTPVAARVVEQDETDAREEAEAEAASGEQENGASS